MSQRYRYPGVRPFETTEQDLFFGRERDCSDLLGLITLEKLVVLFGKSGYGKSSLINAALIPALKGKGITTFSIRFEINTDNQEPLTTILVNYLDRNSSIGLNPKMAFIDTICPEKTLWYQAKRRQEKKSQWVFFFDQFEEYFQQPPAQRRHFEEQLAELLYTDVPQAVLNNSLDCTEAEMDLLVQPLDIRVIFSIRADRLSELEGLKTRLPAILNKRFELKALNQEQAREAIVKPALLDDTDFTSPSYEYKPDALNSILDGLAGPKGGIEAFQLQILCDYIDDKVRAGMVPDRDNNGLPDVEIEDLPDLEQVYGEYYANRLKTLPVELQPAARHIIEEQLIFDNELTGEARRVSLDKDLLLQKTAFQGASESLLYELVKSFLLRREPNSLGGFNYEISHDTLLVPVIKAKRERQIYEQEAAAEQERAQALRRAEIAEEEARRESSRRRRANLVAVVAIMAFLVALGLGLYAFNQRKIALRKSVEVLDQREKAVEALNKMKKAEEDKMIAEIASVMLEAKEIEGRADTLKSDYPCTSLKLYQDAQKLLQDMQRNYPGNPNLNKALYDLKKKMPTQLCDQK